MSERYHEHHREIMSWSWKLFCAKWVRLIEWSAKEKQKQDKRREDQAFEELKRAHKERVG